MPKVEAGMERETKAILNAALQCFELYNNSTNVKRKFLERTIAASLLVIASTGGPLRRTFAVLIVVSFPEMQKNMAKVVP